MNNITAKIHSFESFGTVDGPGIRFIIFMQGCPLKCKYCHNRDTWNPSGGTEYDIDTVINKIVRCKPYFEHSNGGGVTVSGGEPLMQANFVTELFKRLKEININTCIDTSGSYKITPEIENLLSYTDLVLLDIKHINKEKCIDLTGMSNENTLEFAKYLNNHNIPVWIRQVLVPGITDNENDLLELRKFLDTLSNVKRIELLPYHDMGNFKWESLGEIYPLKDTLPPTDAQIKKAKEILRLN